jgi:hypothetical protein
MSLLLAVGLLFAGYLTLKQNTVDTVLPAACAGALIFLGLVDFSYNIQNGIYWISTTSLYMNAIINLWCLGVGSLILVQVCAIPISHNTDQ